MVGQQGNLELIGSILKEKKLHIPKKRIASYLTLFERAQEIFPQPQQQALLVHLLHSWESSKKKVVAQLEELGERQLPLTVVMGVLAEDWSGMGNSILGIIHQKHGNVLFMKGFTLTLHERMLGIVLLSFLISTPEEYGRFLKDKHNLLAALRDASQGTADKTLLLEDETIKFELYSQVIKAIRRVYRGPDLARIIGENGEALKFFSSRSREYLQERKLSDLAALIIDNHNFQKQVREGRADKRIRIKNFETLDERLTGITFVCWEENFSVESFLKTLDFIVPGHIIKHHKSFVSADKLLVYRIEIVDRQGQPLNPEAIRSIEVSLDKLISTAVDETFAQIKSVGGYEHYARAIIPFLMGELKATGVSQVFMSVEKKTEFVLQLKLIVVARSAPRRGLQQLVRRLECSRGIEILSVVPPRLYQKQTEVSILNLRATLADFPSLAAIFQSLKNALKKLYGQVRDFNEGLRDSDMRSLMDLTEQVRTLNPLLIKEIYYNLDEIYRLETPPQVLAEIMRLVCATIRAARAAARGRVVVLYKGIRHPYQNEAAKTIFVVSYAGEKRVLSSFIRNLPAIDVYFTRIEWEQRNYLILILKKDGQGLDDEEIARIRSRVLDRFFERALIIDASAQALEEEC
ncbi:MAG TPA: hypothetical protein PK919_07445 [Candidatus Aminicenantes bacterium]|nr:hypothetical protein [Candidatus Aminicenantes bacterium]